MATSAGFGSLPAGRSTAGPDTLAGSDRSPTANSPEQGTAKRNALVMGIHTSLDDLARQYPEFSEACDKAKNLLTDQMVKSAESSGRTGKGPQLPFTVG